MSIASQGVTLYLPNSSSSDGVGVGVGTGVRVTLKLRGYGHSSDINPPSFSTDTGKNV
ncbi:MAG: hypothetical protein N2V75_13080 [Methanophagales archaeon]|nr:hypothetical protein [Methanophagales archaeon]